MRLLDLDLLAFGPFTNKRLELDRPGALHVVFGPNEAGKSTALRAITNLLYGIPVQTADAHRHAMPDLRIGARLAASDGTVLSVVRRKGSKNTLLEPDGAPLPDDTLAPLLGGVGEPVFRSMFGLDHVSLREGAKALLQGRGNVGESLFAAGFGGRGVHAVLDELENEAGQIFKPRGQNPKLNEAIRLFKQAKKQSSEAAISADAYRVQQEALRAARDESNALVQRRRERTAEQSRLQRVRQVLPLLARRDEYAARRRALGEVAPLPEDARQRRVVAETTARECERERERLVREIELLDRRRRELHPAATLLAIDATTIQEMQDRLGNHRTQEVQLPRLRAELERLEEEAMVMARRLGRPVSLEQIESLRISASRHAVIRKLAQERSGIETTAVEAERALQQQQAREERQRAQLEGLPPLVDLQALQATVKQAGRRGGIEDSLAEMSAHAARLEADLHRKGEALGLSRLDPSALDGLVLPAGEDVERFAARFQANEQEAQELNRRRRAWRERLVAVRRRLEELRLTGDVPSEEQLGEQRARRDATWQDIRRRCEKAERVDASTVRTFEAELRACDELADRLRREADRVATRARLRAEESECEEEGEALDRDTRATDAAREKLQEKWRALWSTLGTDPGSPVEMRTWIRRAEEAVRQAEELSEKRAAMAHLEESRERHCGDLRAALREAGEPAAGHVASLESLLEVARGVLDEQHERAARRAELARSVEETRAEIRDRMQRCEESRRAFAAWREAWREAVVVLDLPGEADAVQALAVLDERAELFNRMSTIQQIRRRVDGIERDMARFAQRVSELCERYAPELGEQPPAEAADRLLHAHRRAVQDDEQGRRVEADLQSKRAELDECEQRAARAEREIEELRQLARAVSRDDLEQAEMRAAEAARLDADLQRVEEQLFEAGEGARIDDLVRESRGVHADEVRSRLDEIESEREELEERQAGLLQQIGSLEEGLRHLEAGERAADAALEAQEHLAAIKSGVRKYVRLRLAAVVLRREIERYRERAQGPLLARAEKLFPRLTLDRYTGLRVGFDANDEPVLRCIRKDGREVGVDALSDGTRDQLYLALRVATLEHHAETNDPLPVVLDDVLIHFDDRRAAAALEVLAELAAGVQVLFFTHHRHLMDLARRTLPAEVVVEHELHPE